MCVYLHSQLNPIKMTVKDKMKFKEFLSINLHGKKEERRNYRNKIY